jgi:hypothetical protein
MSFPVLFLLSCPVPSARSQENPRLCVTCSQSQSHSRHHTAQYGMAWHGMAWHGMAWHSMAWHSIVEAHSQQLSTLSSVGCVNHSTFSFLRIHYLSFFDLSRWPPYSTPSYSYLDFQVTTLSLSPHTTPHYT